MAKPLFVGVDEVQHDWGISRSKAYEIIRIMSKQLAKDNPKALILSGKINRAFYEECCRTKKAQ